MFILFGLDRAIAQCGPCTKSGFFYARRGHRARRIVVSSDFSELANSRQADPAYQGEVYAISRWVGVKAGAVGEKLGDPAQLPSVQEAHAKAASQTAKRLQELRDIQNQKVDRFKAVFVQRRKALAARRKADQKRLSIPAGFQACWVRACQTCTPPQPYRQGQTRRMHSQSRCAPWSALRQNISELGWWFRPRRLSEAPQRSSLRDRRSRFYALLFSEGTDVNRNKTPLSEKLLWNVQDCANAMSCHPNTIWNRVRAGNFVQPIKWDGKTVWRRSDVENFVERLAG
ncbi:MAG: hypothetical protein N4A61_04830 [Pelagimonas sp.]|nr:hypothetical protein [Pelagimonas sp.]